MNKYLDLAWEQKIAENDGDSDISWNWSTWNGPQVFEKRLEEL